MVEIRKIGDGNKEIKAYGTPEFPGGVPSGEVVDEDNAGVEGQEPEALDVTKGLPLKKVPGNAYTDENPAAAEARGGGAQVVLREEERGPVLNKILAGETVNFPGLNLDLGTDDGAADVANLAMPGLEQKNKE